MRVDGLLFVLVLAYSGSLATGCGAQDEIGPRDGSSDDRSDGGALDDDGGGSSRDDASAPRADAAVSQTDADVAQADAGATRADAAQPSTDASLPRDAQTVPDAQPGDGAASDASMPQGDVEPPLGQSSGGSGGPTGGAVSSRRTAGGVSFRIVAPDRARTNVPLLIVYSGTEGGATMAQNLSMLEQIIPALSTYARAVLDGVVYRDNGLAGADVLDEMRQLYDVDNDRTYLLGESAGTTAAFSLGFHHRQSWFAAYWANDVAAPRSDGPERDAADLGFAPWGQVGPGGQAALAQAIADRMVAGGYRTDPVTPYSGPGANQHGSPDQFIAALRWFEGKSRR